jgi:phage FluMu protein Com
VEDIQTEKPKRPRAKNIMQRMIEAGVEPSTRTQLVARSKAARGAGKSKELTTRLDDKNRAVARRIFSTIGRHEVIESLLHGNDERMMQLVHALMDQKFDKVSFMVLCRRHGITPVDIVDAFRKYKLDQAVIDIARSMPHVAQDTVEDALSSMVLCERCDGKTWVPDVNKEGEEIERKCPMCKGAGEVRQKGDNKSKELIFKSGGLIKDVPGAAVQVNVGAGSLRSMDSFVKDTPSLLPALEVEDADRQD